jgi:hypothetical protein
MLAHAFLVLAAVAERARRPSPSGLVPLTCNELQHLFAALVARPVGDLGHRLRWSVWRRRHQARARSDMVEVVGARRRRGDSLGVADRNLSCSAWLQAAPWSGAQAATRRAGGEHLTDGRLQAG